jgi:GDP-mannose 6-dehydrogenase
MMKISIFGLGYIGCVSAGCLTSFGHNVIGVDINNRKVDQINDGSTPVSEPGLSELISDGVENGQLSATTDPAVAIEESELSLVCVGTPEGQDGTLDTTNLYNVIDSIAPSVSDDHTIAIRSTAPPGTTRDLRQYLRRQVDQAAPQFVVNPEFLREGTAVSDFENPPYTVIGKFSEERTAIERLYQDLPISGDTYTVSPEAAELLKLANNTFHALKISFANELGSIASQYGVNGNELMDLVKSDSKLNISEKYLNPGFAYGGACLPKDTRATEELASKKSMNVPLISSIAEANDAHIERIAAEANDMPGETVGIVGISFKEGTRDVRNSPSIELAKSLEKEIAFFTDSLDFSEFVGSNRSYFDKSIAEINPQIFAEADEFADTVDIVIFTNDGNYDELLEQVIELPVIDPVGAAIQDRDRFLEYRTISW